MRRWFQIVLVAAETALRCKQLVLATGAYGPPKEINLPGAESFAGEQYHSSRHVSGEGFLGKRAIVIGHRFHATRSRLAARPLTVVVKLDRDAGSMRERRGRFCPGIDRASVGRQDNHDTPAGKASQSAQQNIDCLIRERVEHPLPVERRVGPRLYDSMSMPPAIKILFISGLCGRYRRCNLRAYPNGVHSDDAAPRLTCPGKRHVYSNLTKECRGAPKATG
jgi:hypothetical protein